VLSFGLKQFPRIRISAPPHIARDLMVAREAIVSATRACGMGRRCQPQTPSARRASASCRRLLSAGFPVERIGSLGSLAADGAVAYLSGGFAPLFGVCHGLVAGFEP